MKKKIEFAIIAILAVATIVLVIMLLLPKDEKQEEVVTIYDEKIEAEALRLAEEGEQKNVKLEDDFTRTNISEKLKETKKVENLEISEIALVAKENSTVFSATVTNKGTEVVEGFDVKLRFVDEKGNTIQEIIGYINRVEPEKTVDLTTSAQRDFANAYDVEIMKKSV